MAEKRRTPWNEIHRPLDRALAAAGLSPCEQVIMQHAREMCYATAKAHRRDDPLPFRFNQTEFADRIGINRPKVNQAFRRLVETRLLVASGKGFIVNKHYRTWLPPHQLCPKQVDYANAGLEWSPLDLSNTCFDPGTPTVPIREHLCSQPGTTPVPGQEQSCSRSGTPTVPIREQGPSKEGRARPGAPSVGEIGECVRGESVRGEDTHTRKDRSETSDPRPGSPEWYVIHGDPVEA